MSKAGNQSGARAEIEQRLGLAPGTLARSEVADLSARMLALKAQTESGERTRIARRLGLPDGAVAAIPNSAIRDEVTALAARIAELRVELG